MAAAATDGLICTGRFVAHPWLCDAMGHLTTRHYVGFFDDASYHLLAEAGYDGAKDLKAGWGWADVRHELEYKAEISAGALVEVWSRIVALGNSSVRSEHHMRERSQGVLSATLIANTVCFDLKARRSMPLPDAFRTRAAAYFGLET